MQERVVKIIHAGKKTPHTGVQQSLACLFQGETDKAPSQRYSCLASLLGCARATRPGSGRHRELRTTWPLTQLHQAGEQRLRAPGDSLAFDSRRLAWIPSAELGRSPPEARGAGNALPRAPGESAGAPYHPLPRSEGAGYAWFALDSIRAAP